ncbi:MAG TPA: argininosuccinate lyase, partial [Aquifex aeolicus]|nr:argininosuccinate lyase [Aquifex aeolicus]
ILELIRGKTGRLYGNLISLLTTLKGLPTAYNRDLQEDKEPLFDSVRTLKGSLVGMRKVLEGISFAGDRMFEGAGGFALMTDLADFLVEKGLPFRRAHHIVGSIVSYLLSKGKKPEDLSLEELKSFSPLFDEEALSLLSPDKIADRRRTYGGTAREEIERIIRVAEREEDLLR